MRTFVLGAVSVLVLAMASACSRPASTVAAASKSAAPAATNDYATVIAKAKYRVTHDFHDPASAQFREIVVYHVGEQINVCGSVNGKNLTGGYVGFEPFYYYAANDTGDVTPNVNSDACRNATVAQVADESRQAQAKEDALHHETPLPAGYVLAGEVPYADTSVDAAALDAIHTSNDGGDEIAEVDGSRVKVMPRKTVAMAGGALIIATGTKDECHACEGVVQLFFWFDRQDAKYSVQEVGPVIQDGSWGQAPEIAIYKPIQKGALGYYMRLTTEFMGQGCTEKRGRLYHVEGNSVLPVADAYSVDEGCVH